MTYSKYTSYEDLANIIRQNIWKIPANTDLIVGCPRSGLICALMISEIINKPVIDLDGFINGQQPWIGGSRTHLAEKELKYKNILVLEDTSFTSNSIIKAKQRILEMPNANELNVLSCAIFAEGADAKNKVDIYFIENYNPNCWNIYEWNILQHDIYFTQFCMFDIDGIICKDPPDERNKEAYEKYIENAIPQVIPSSQVQALVTFRLNKYRDVTEKWLKDHGVQYNMLYMFNSDSYEVRSHYNPAEYKAMIYKNANWAQMFIESDIWQAPQIAQLSEKPVFCYANGKVYGPIYNYKNEPIYITTTNKITNNNFVKL